MYYGSDGQLIVQTVSLPSCHKCFEFKDGVDLSVFMVYMAVLGRSSTPLGRRKVSSHLIEENVGSSGM